MSAPPQPPRPPVQHSSEATAESVEPAAPATSGPASAPTPAQTVVAGAPAAAAVSPDWRAALLAWLRAHRVYPEEARRRGEEGEVDLRFAVMQDGTVTSVTVTRSSGSNRLDAAALTILRGAHVPPFPPDMKAIETVQTARIRYRLDE